MNLPSLAFLCGFILETSFAKKDKMLYYLRKNRLFALYQKLKPNSLELGFFR